jgi:hypothetical protein
MTILNPVVGILCTTLFLLLWYPKQIKTGWLIPSLKQSVATKTCFWASHNC